MQLPASSKKILCPACKQSRVLKFNTVDAYDLLFCNNCCLRFVDPHQVTDDTLDEFYKDSYFEGSKVAKERGIGYADYRSDDKLIKKNFEKILLKIRRQIKSKVNPRSLEVGCAYGYTVKIAKDHGLDSYGIDVFKNGIDYGKNILGIQNLKNISVEKYCEENTGQFDFIFLIGTLEHLRDPVNILKKCHRLLTSDGTLIVTTVHTEGLLGRCNYKPPEHLFYFTRKSLELFYKQAGFKKPFSYATYFKFYKISEFLRLAAPLLPFNIDWFSNWRVWRHLKLLVPTNEVIIKVLK